jgi:hypothetical protein
MLRVATSVNLGLASQYICYAFLSVFKVLAAPVLATLFAVIQQSMQKVNLGTRWRRGLQQQDKSDDKQ